MKRTLHLFSIILIASLVSTACCFITYHHLQGYSYIPSGPITLLELENFNFKDIKDNKGNGIPDMEFQYTSVSIKKQFDSSFTYVRTLNPFRTAGASFTDRLNEITQELTIGDSITLHNFYFHKNTGSYYENNYEKQQKYGVKSQNIAELIRKGSSFITTFPNPVMDKLNIHCDVSNLIEAKYMLLDQAGRKVFENDISDIRTPTVLSTASYTTGVYYLYLIIDGELFTKKIVKS
ncbi:MAG TPA: hypothetical protein DCX01_04570 [Bacteroidetes bacterium]|nr:hypothetical protein [Bacteroidota bacterium]